MFKKNKNILICVVLIIILFIVFLYFQKEKQIENFINVSGTWNKITGKNKSKRKQRQLRNKKNKEINELKKQIDNCDYDYLIERNKEITEKRDRLRNTRDDLKKKLFALEESKLDHDYEIMQKDLLLEEQDEKLDEIRNVINY